MKQKIRRLMVFGWGSHPLRRRIDRLEAGMITGLIVLFLIASPVLMAVVMHGIRAAGMRQLRAEVTWRQVAATVTQSAAGPEPGPLGMAATVWKPARWTAPDGQPRSGRIPVSPHAAAGTRARVWVNRSGSLTGWPLRRAQLQGRITIFGVLTAAVLGVLLGVAGWAGRFLIGRRRIAAWGREWRAVGPRWTRQL